VVKLADFGLARIYDLSHEGGVQSMSHQVATRQYRAPELLFASRRYDFSVDVWSCAVIVCELFLQMTLFPGCSDLDQMSRVFRTMGSPTEDNWPVRIMVVLCLNLFVATDAVNGVFHLLSIT
jgi:serine/threonine protein kinase